jgi:alpha-L-fucosidase
MAGVKNEKIDTARMVGDYDTPEQVVGRLNMNTPWESSFTICHQWAWKPNDKMKSLQQCLSILSQTAGGNGNLLLNVGPMPDGRIEARQVTRLKEIGDWLKINGEAIYNTLGGPYDPTDAYATTRKENNIYLHVLKTDTAAIELKNIPGRNIIKVHTIDGENITVENGASTFKVLLPSSRAGKTEYIIVLELDGDAETIPVLKN